MTSSTDPSTPPAAGVALTQGAAYRAVWRWHFYAGLIVAPFAIFLAVTGAIYLWRPQYEAWRYRDLLRTPSVGTAAVPADGQLAAARTAAPPGWRAQSYQPAFAPGETAQVIFQPPGAGLHSPGLTVFVDPQTGRLLGRLHDEETLMAQVKKLHGTLFAGAFGEYVVELVASGALVLFLTGFYLAWPRPKFTPWGFLLPRLRAEGRVFWRDLHAVPAVWCSAGTVFLLVTGLLWTQAAGSWYRKVSAVLGQGSPRESFAGAHRSALTGWSPPLRAGLAERIDRLASAPPATDEHASHGPGMHPVAPAPEGPFVGALSLDRAMALAEERAVPRPFVVGLPVGPEGVFSAISDSRQPFRRVFLHLDQYSGRVLAEVTFRDFGYLAQFYSWGIVAHEGRLFGLANQVLGTLAAVGVILLGVTGLAMWWRRRPVGRLAIPDGGTPLPRPVLLGTFLLATLLPMLAATLALFWLGDRLLPVQVSGRRMRTP